MNHTALAYRQGFTCLSNVAQFVPDSYLDYVVEQAEILAGEARDNDVEGKDLGCDDALESLGLLWQHPENKFWYYRVWDETIPPIRSRSSAE